MKSVLPAIIVVGMLVFSAAGSQAYGPGAGSRGGITANRPALTKIHSGHVDCRFGPVGGWGWHGTVWHKHENFQTSGWISCTKRVDIGNHDKPAVVAPRCAAKPGASSKCPYATEWTCAKWYVSLKNCCTKWRCTSVIK